MMKSIKNTFLFVFFLIGIRLNVAQKIPPGQQAVYLKQSLSDREAVVWYLGHCGYAVRTKSKLLVFDYQEKVRLPDRSEVKPPAQRSLFNGWVDPEEIKDLDVLVFASHSHSDHYDPIVLSWEKKIAKIAYIFGWQEKVGGLYHSLPAPRKSLTLDGVEIYTVNSHHSGVPESGFLVKLDGLTLFHQGDYIGRMGGDEVPFTVSEDLSYLKTKYDRVDIYFTHAGTWKPQLEMMASFRPGLVLPMHYGYREGKYAEFLAEVKDQFPGTDFFIPQKKGDVCHYRDGALVISTNHKVPVNRLVTPQKDPERFLPGLVAGDQHDFVLRLRPGMDELYLMCSDAEFNTTIHSYILHEGCWQDGGAAPIPFDGQIAYPTFSSDGQNLFFDGLKEGEAPDIWMSSKHGEGWTAPVRLGPDVNSPAVEMLCSVAANGISTSFASWREGGLGKCDLYISFQEESGRWGDPCPLPPGVNSEANERFPVLSPDGKYLFFLSSRTIPGAGPHDPGNGSGDVYWVSAAIIEELRKEALKK